MPEVYDIDEINNQLNILENTKLELKQTLINKGQNVQDSTPFNSYISMIDNLIDVGDATATSDDIYNAIAYAGTAKVVGTLQNVQGLNREELQKRVEIWNLYNVLSTNNMYISGLFENLKEDFLPTLIANDVMDISSLYFNCTNVIKIDVSNINTQNLDNLVAVFYDCTNLINIIGINNWDVSNVGTMQDTFRNCSNLTNIDVSNWNTNTLFDIIDVFAGCSNLLSIDVSNWNTDSVYRIENIFCGCSNLSSIDISSWNLDSVGSFRNLWCNCYNLVDLNLHSLNFQEGMIELCLNNLYIPSLRNIDMSDLVLQYYQLDNLFYGQENLVTINVNNCNMFGSYDNIDYIFYRL